MGSVLLVLPLSGAALAGMQGPCDGSVTIDGRTYGPDNDTADDPIVVPDEPGLVASWTGSTGVVITDHTGKIGLVVGPATVPIDTWGGENAEQEVSAAGDYAVDEARAAMPMKVVGLYELKGSHSGQGGTCSGNAMVLVEGAPLTTPVGAGAAAGTLLALGGLVLAGRPR